MAPSPRSSRASRPSMTFRVPKRPTRLRWMTFAEPSANWRVPRWDTSGFSTGFCFSQESESGAGQRSSFLATSSRRCRDNPSPSWNSIPLGARTFSIFETIEIFIKILYYLDIHFVNSWIELNTAKEKLEIVIRAAPPPFRIFAGGLPRRLRRRNAFGLIQEYCTRKEFASLNGSPRFARRLIRIGFSGQKRIGDFLKHGSSRLFSEMLSFRKDYSLQSILRLDLRILRTHEPVRAK